MYQKPSTSNIALIDPTKALNAVSLSRWLTSRLELIQFTPHTSSLLSALFVGDFHAVLWRITREHPADFEIFARVADQWPVVVVVSPSDENLLDKAFEYGAHDFVYAPVKQRRLDIALLNAAKYQQSRWDRPSSPPTIQASLDCSECSASLDHPFPSENRRQTLAEIEACSIKKSLLMSNWNISQTARQLGIGRSTLYRKMKTYEIAQEDNSYSAIQP